MNNDLVNASFAACLDYLETGVQMWGANGFRPYGEGHDPSSFIKEILSLTPEGAATVLNRLWDKYNEPGYAPTDGAIDNFSDNAYQDLIRESDPHWMEEFNTHFNFGE